MASIKAEADAIKAVAEAVAPLDFMERRRVLVYIACRFGIDHRKLGGAIEGDPA